jgi:hypothetical protein
MAWTTEKSLHLTDLLLLHVYSLLWGKCLSSHCPTMLGSEHTDKQGARWSPKLPLLFKSKESRLKTYGHGSVLPNLVYIILKTNFHFTQKISHLYVTIRGHEIFWYTDAILSEKKTVVCSYCCLMGDQVSGAYILEEHVSIILPSRWRQYVPPQHW